MADSLFDKDISASEYFCCNCGQLRLSLNPAPIKCGNCHSYNIVRGSVGSLDKQKLKEKYNV